MAGKKRQMTQYIGCRVAVSCLDGREIVGKLLSFDRHSNLILSDSERFTETKNRKRQRTSLGLVMLRGESVVSISFRDSITTNSDVVDDRLR